MVETRHQTILAEAAGLSDADLLRRVAALAGRERAATVDLVAHLAEFDARRLYLGEGFGSLFAYCTGALRLAEHAAYNRIEAARASREHPLILDLLADGSLNLSTVRLLAPHLRPESFASVVAMAKGKSKREVEILVARLAPRADVAPSVRKLPASVPPARPATLSDSPPCLSPPAPNGPRGRSVTPVDSTAPERPAHRPVVTPLAPERYRVQFTIVEGTHEKLRRAQDLLRREIPDGDPGTIFDRALTLLLDDIARKKLAKTSKPRPCLAAATRSRRIPARVKRAVWLRDGGRCAFVAPSGRRCTERAFLEFHHLEPYAIGGEATTGNISPAVQASQRIRGGAGPGVERVSRRSSARGSRPPAARQPGVARSPAV